MEGTVTTKNGHEIIPYRVFYRHGRFQTNLIEFMNQPRVVELKKQMQPLLLSPVNDKFALNSDTGEFFLQSDIDRNGPGNATVLGQIDLELEKKLFNHAAQMVMLRKLFGDCSADNPLVLDEKTGRVYPADNPQETRGYMKPGPKVEL